MKTQLTILKGDGNTPHRRDKARTVAALKLAARKQLISQGVAGLSIQSILNNAGVSRGALFHHFPTKNHLIAAAFADLLEASADRLRTVGGDLRANRITLDQFVENVRDVFCSDLFVGSMEIALSNRVEPVLRELVSDAVERWWTSLASFWTDAFDLPGLSAAEANQHWTMASNLLRGHAFTSTYRSLPEMRIAFCVSFQRIILADAVVREAHQHPSAASELHNRNARHA